MPTVIVLKFYNYIPLLTIKFQINKHSRYIPLEVKVIVQREEVQAVKLFLYVTRTFLRSGKIGEWSDLPSSYTLKYIRRRWRRLLRCCIYHSNKVLCRYVETCKYQLEWNDEEGIKVEIQTNFYHILIHVIQKCCHFERNNILTPREKFPDIFPNWLQKQLIIK